MGFTVDTVQIPVKFPIFTACVVAEFEVNTSLNKTKFAIDRESFPSSFQEFTKIENKLSAPVLK